MGHRADAVNLCVRACVRACVVRACVRVRVCVCVRVRAWPHPVLAPPAPADPNPPNRPGPAARRAAMIGPEPWYGRRHGRALARAHTHYSWAGRRMSRACPPHTHSRPPSPRPCPTVGILGLAGTCILVLPFIIIITHDQVLSIEISLLHS